ncbi:MAG TPA: hypothetical protein VMD59_23370, partial [Acidimicrobiales bacterium]|nr:hypothetical protein [Acidimicrobiales bacterium]
SQLAAAPAPAGGGGWIVVATDVRGPFTLVVYHDGSTLATCLTGPSFTLVHQSGGGFQAMMGGAARGPGGSGPAPHGVRVTQRVGGSSSASSAGSYTLVDGQIEQISEIHLDSSSAGSYTLVDGQIDPQVTGVTLVRSDGSDVVASTGDGWFVAWWPGAEGATSAEVISASGTATESLAALGARPTSSGQSADPGRDGASCASGSAGSSASSGASGTSGSSGSSVPAGASGSSGSTGASTASGSSGASSGPSCATGASGVSGSSSESSGPATSSRRGQTSHSRS